MRTFVLGVGAAKAGTSWLHSYLAAQDFSDFGFAKEYHIFDSLAIPECKWFRTRAERNVEIGIKEGFLKRSTRHDLYRLNFMYNPESYFDYFSEILSRSEIFLTGDITPSYSGLPGADLTAINYEFSRRNITVKPIFLMRDPVYRLQSTVRMHFRRKGKIATLEAEIAEMKKLLGTPKDSIRSNYIATLSNLNKVFGLENVFIGVFENFFRVDVGERLSRYLGVNLNSPPIHIGKNVSRTENHLSEDMYLHFRETYAEMIDSAQEITGLELKAIWNWKVPA